MFSCCVDRDPRHKRCANRLLLGAVLDAFVDGQQVSNARPCELSLHYAL